MRLRRAENAARADQIGVDPQYREWCELKLRASGRVVRGRGGSRVRAHARWPALHVHGTRWHLLRWLRTLLRLVRESLRDGVPLLFSLLKRLSALVRRWCRRRHLTERERRRAPGRCVPIHEPAYKRPDPLIYSQHYLMTLGMAVTRVEGVSNTAPLLPNDGGDGLTRGR